jgi:hypothetical protein
MERKIHAGKGRLAGGTRKRISKPKNRPPDRKAFAIRCSTHISVWQIIFMTAFT